MNKKSSLRNFYNSAITIEEILFFKKMLSDIYSGLEPMFEIGTRDIQILAAKVMKDPFKVYDGDFSPLTFFPDDDVSKSSKELVAITDPILLYKALTLLVRVTEESIRLNATVNYEVVIAALAKYGKEICQLTNLPLYTSDDYDFNVLRSCIINILDLKTIEASISHMANNHASIPTMDENTRKNFAMSIGDPLEEFTSSFLPTKPSIFAQIECENIKWFKFLTLTVIALKKCDDANIDEGHYYPIMFKVLSNFKNIFFI